MLWTIALIEEPWAYADNATLSPSPFRQRLVVESFGALTAPYQFRILCLFQNHGDADVRG
jgi:hypothetical protein